jgi:hypothetical protein
MNKFERDVLADLGDWAVCRRLFYKPPVGHVLCGFGLENALSGQYISECCQPICDRVDFISLDFGGRLPDPVGYIPRQNGQLQLSAADFVKRVTPYIDEVMQCQTLEGFAKKFGEHLYNSGARRNYATVLILLGRYEEAADELRKCFRDTRDEAHTRDTRQLLQTLEKDPADAVRLLHAWESETRRKFDIPG